MYNKIGIYRSASIFNGYSISKPRAHWMSSSSGALWRCRYGIDEAEEVYVNLNAGTIKVFFVEEI
jgi:hypothetical protein